MEKKVFVNLPAGNPIRLTDADGYTDQRGPIKGARLEIKMILQKSIQPA